MDYKGLIYFIKERDLSRRQIRYLDILSKYNIKIIYQPDLQNIKVNALTRISGLILIDPANARLKQ